ncbi:MAG: histidinol-phosphatase [Clostridia bacterium]|nr:histidinol-phosphatase [Clostridia bacterium]
MIPSNLHTHTTHCDGKSTVREMIEAAIERGFVSLGFSGHSPMSAPDDSWSLKDEEAYIAEVRALAEEYKDRIEVYCGIEWDVTSAIDRSRYDYAIGSVHMLENEHGKWALDLSLEELMRCINDGFGGDPYAMCEAYYAEMAENAMRDGVDVVGHFDVLTKHNGDGAAFDEEHPRYRGAALSALDAICTARPDIIFECNVGGMVRAGRKEPYPPLWLLRELKARDMRVTLTSDAHRAENLSEGFDRGIEFLREAGFTRAYILKENKFTKVKI